MINNLRCLNLKTLCLIGKLRRGLMFIYTIYIYLTLIFLPLLSSLIPGFLGRKIGVKGTHFITCVSISITTILAMIIFMEVGLNSIPVEIKLFK
jgi:hypothetical protein